MWSSMSLSLNDDPWEDFKKSNRLSQLYLSVIHIFFQYLPTQFHLQLEGSWDTLLKRLYFSIGAAVSICVQQQRYSSIYIIEWKCLYCKLHHFIMPVHLPWTAHLALVRLTKISPGLRASTSPASIPHLNYCYICWLPHPFVVSQSTPYIVTFLGCSDRVPSQLPHRLLNNTPQKNTQFWDY